MWPAIQIGASFVNFYLYGQTHDPLYLGVAGLCWVAALITVALER